MNAACAAAIGGSTSCRRLFKSGPQQPRLQETADSHALTIGRIEATKLHPDRQYSARQPTKFFKMLPPVRRKTEVPAAEPMEARARLSDYRIRSASSVRSRALVKSSPGLQPQVRPRGPAIVMYQRSPSKGKNKGRQSRSRADSSQSTATFHWGRSCGESRTIMVE